MSNYKKVLKVRIVLCGILAIIMMGLGVWEFMLLEAGTHNNEILAFQLGIVVGIVFLSIMVLIRTCRILRDEKKIQEEYIRVNDERYKAIRGKAGVPIILITSILMVIAGIVAGYFNITVFWTLIAAAICQMIISIVVKTVCMKKM